MSTSKTALAHHCHSLHHRRLAVDPQAAKVGPARHIGAAIVLAVPKNRIASLALADKAEMLKSEREKVLIPVLINMT